MKQKKIFGDERRKQILQWLTDSRHPLTGGELAERANVSRQVIVQDISLLKAKNEPIIATSQGYMYLQQNKEEKLFERVVACKHTPEQTRDELQLIVDHGVTVKDVIIEHPVYGDLKASIMVSNRSEVEQFTEQVETTDAPYLLELTGGVHLHTLQADSESKLDNAPRSLQEANYIVT